MLHKYAENEPKWTRCGVEQGLLLGVVPLSLFCVLFLYRLEAEDARAQLNIFLIVLMKLEGKISSLNLLREVDEGLGEIYFIDKDGRRGAFDHLSHLFVSFPNKDSIKGMLVYLFKLFSCPLEVSWVNSVV